MTYQTLAEFAQKKRSIPAGIVGIVLCESGLHATASAKRLAQQGVSAIIALGEGVEASAVDCPVFTIAERPRHRETDAQLNLLIDLLAGRWLVWLWNGEFLVFPFCETRVLADLVAFLCDERRRLLYCYALDLYAQDLPGAADCPMQAGLSFDRTGYYAFPDADQQLRVYGGLGWRLQELVPRGMEQIGRSTLFRAKAGVHLGSDLTFELPEYASVSCPWHNSPTGAVMSLRRTRRIMAHPKFATVRSRLEWSGTEAFRWNSAQLLDEGMIEPGQWF